MPIYFRELLNEIELEASNDIIRNSFKTVAAEYNLTQTNAPTNPAFITQDDLIKMLQKGIKLFGVFNGNIQIGFVAIERATERIYYMEKLAVLPQYRHNGFGKLIIDFVFEYARKYGGEKVSIALINENSVLKDWYLKYGFMQTGIKQFSHLPFAVCFMEKIT